MKMRLVLRIIIILMIILIYKKCSSDNKLNDEELNSMIENYVKDAVYNFKEELDTLGGTANWKNYQDYFGLGKEGYKERIQETWGKKYDGETLEFLINDRLEKKGIKYKINLGNGSEYSNIYVNTLLSPIIEESYYWVIITFLGVAVVPISLLLLILMFLSSFCFKNFFVKLSQYCFMTIIIIIALVVHSFFYNFNDTLEGKMTQNIITDIYTKIDNVVSKSNE